MIQIKLDQIFGRFLKMGVKETLSKFSVAVHYLRICPLFV